MSKALTLIVSLSGKEVSAQFAHDAGTLSPTAPIKESILIDGMAPGISHISTSIKKVFEQVEKQSEGHIKTIHVFLSAPWSLSQSRTIHLNNSKGLEVSERALAKIIEEEKKTFEDFAKKENFIRGEEKLIEAKVMDILANGYQVGTTVPKGIVTHLDILVFMSIGNASLIKKIIELGEKHFHTHQIMFHTAPIALYSAVTETDPLQSNFTIVHVSDESTEVVLVKKRAIHESLVIPFGSNVFLKEVSKTLGASLPLSNSFLRMHGADKLDELTRTKITNALTKSTDKWRTIFCEAVNKISEETFIPHSVALFAPQSIAGALTEAIESGDCSAQVTNSNGFTVKPYDERIVYETDFINKLSVLED